MLTLDAARTLTRDEAAELLATSRGAINDLVERGVLPPQMTLADIEAYFRDRLLHLYRSMAGRMAGVDAPAHSVEEKASEEESGFAIVRSFEDFQATMGPRQKPQHRRAPRYEPQRAITGTYRDMEFTVLEISATGMRIRHDATVHAGDEARITFSVPKPAGRKYSFRGRIVWTTIAQRGNGPSFCLSGVQVTANVDHLQKVVAQLREGDASGKGSASSRTPPPLVGLSDDEVASIIRAHRRFSSDPVEASRWYSRARFSVTEAAVRKAAPERARDRDEVLGIWEYLQRQVTIDAVTSVVTWLRQTRSAAAV